MKNYKIDCSNVPHDELVLIKTSGSFNTWRIFFETFEHEDERVTETREFIEKVMVEKEGIDPETGEVTKYEVEEDVIVEKEVTTRVYESKYVDIVKHKDEVFTALSAIKELTVKEIDLYDTSDEVNCFLLNGNKVWLDKSTRVGLMNSTTIQKQASDLTETTLWLGTVPITINCDLAIHLLMQLELYALDCFNKTAEHKKNVQTLETIKEVAEYDYTIGYPEKLDLKL